MKGQYLQKISTDLTAAISSIEELKAQGQKIVFTNGCFDLLHSGHLQYLDEAKSLGDFLVLGINSDESVRFLKGEHRPILPLDERMEILCGLQMIDMLIPFQEETPLNLIETVKPDILVKGGDYEMHEIVGADFVMANQGRVEVLSFKEGSSTTNVIDTILKRYKNDKD